MEKGFVFSTLGLQIFGLIAILVALTSNYWVHTKQEQYEAYSGLLKGCVKFSSVDVSFCAAFDDPPIEITVVKVLVILGLLLVALAIACVVMRVLRWVQYQKLLEVGSMAQIGSGMLLIIGIVLYVARIYLNPDKDMHEEGFSLHVGFVFAAISALIAFICAGLLWKLGPYIDSDIVQDIAGKD